MNTQLILHKFNSLKSAPGYHPLLKTLELSKKATGLKMQLIRNEFRSLRRPSVGSAEEIYSSCIIEQENARMLYDRITIADLQQSGRYDSLIPEIETIHENLEICECNIRRNVAIEKTAQTLNLISERLQKLLPVSN